MKLRVRSILLVAALVGGNAGCDNKEKEAEAQREAATKAEQAAKDARDAQEKAAAAQKTAADEAERAKRVEAKAQLQKQVDAADRKIGYLKEKAGKVTGATKKNVDAAVTELDKRHATVTTSMNKLDASAAATWATARAQSEADIAALNTSVDALETTLKGK